MFFSGRVLVALVLAAAAATLARAQTVPDLSGTWTLDPAKSDAGVELTPAPAGRGAAGGLAANQILIEQTPIELTLTQSTRQATYKLDGSENWSPSVKSNASWADGKLIITWRREVYLGPRAGQGAFENQTGRDVYDVAGNVLTIDRSTTTSRGTKTGKLVYNKS